MKRVKFKGDCKLLDVFKVDIKHFFKVNYAKEDYVIIPTPIPTKRLKERGFNQVTYLINQLPHEKQDLFTKISDDKQSKKSKKERLELRTSFKIKKPVNLTKKKILIIDDLYTTGATIHNLARELLKHGYEQEINSFTLFRG